MSRPATRGSAAPRRSAKPTVRSAARPTDKPSTGTRSASRSALDDLPIHVVPTENLPGFRELGLPRGLINALARNGIESPFPIQAATIPDVLAGRDLLGRAATGAGKTLAFGLPLIARLEGASAAPHRPRGLVLVPTRELAMQVTDALAPLAHARGLSVRLVAGGLPIHKQIQSLEKGVDILIATPGRLVDLIERRSCRLDAVEITVLDEADHMADLGFLPVVRDLLDQTPSDGQRLLFSATLDGDVATLVEKYLTDPAAHAISSSAASVDTMTHHVFRVPFEAKFDLVASIAAREGRSILFVRTKHGADRLARNLARVGVAAGALHGGRTQAQRNRALTAFKEGSVPVLVATDVAARGIHVDDVSLVLHVDPPQDAKDYLHRSGRTARAGESGVVVLLSIPAEERKVRRLLDEAGVQPEHRDGLVGDAGIAGITGARRPSGVAIPEPRADKPKAVRVGPSGNAQRAGKPARPGGHARPHRDGEQREHADRRPRTEHADRRPRTERTEHADRHPRQDAAARPERTRQNGSSSKRRPAASAATTRHPQHAERRPRRARAN